VERDSIDVFRSAACVVVRNARENPQKTEMTEYPRPICLSVCKIITTDEQLT